MQTTLDDAIYYMLLQAQRIRQCKPIDKHEENGSQASNDLANLLTNMYNNSHR